MILNIMRRVEEKDWRFGLTAAALSTNDVQGAAQRNQLFCMDCGSPVREWVTFTYKDLRFLVCRNCSGRDDTERSQRKSRLGSRMTSIAADILKAHDLDPDNKTITENVGELRKIATDLGLSIPGLTGGAPSRQPAYTPPPPPRPSVPVTPRPSTPTVRPTPTRTAAGWGEAPGSLARLFAFLIDGLFILIVIGIITGTTSLTSNPQSLVWIVGGSAFIYYTLCYVLAKRTLGEAAIKARLVSRADNLWSAGKAFARTLIFAGLLMVIYGVTGVGLIVMVALIIIVLFTKDHRSLADMLAGTWLMKS
jgi:uncharacterized RDD family membrane protein YckC